MANNRNLLDEYVERLDQFDPDSPDHATRDEALDKLRTNLDYLKTELNDLAKKIKDVKSEIESHNRLESRNSNLVTILVALYVPLAFATSFLGMNIDRDPTKAWLQPDTGEDDPNPRTWDIRWFWIIAAPLLFATIILPLVTGPLVRWGAQSYIELKSFWRLGFCIFGFSYLVVYYLLYYFLVPPFDSWITPFRAFCDVPLEIFALYQPFVAFREKQRRLLWCLFWLFASVLLVLDFAPILGYVYSVSRSAYLSAGYVLWGGFGWFGLLLILLVIYFREAAAGTKHVSVGPQMGGKRTSTARSVF